jgi:hypothetical protein
MTRALQTGGLLLLATAIGLGAQKGSPKQPKEPPAPAEHIAPPPRGLPKGEMKGFPKGQQKGPGGRLGNPANQFERLIAMPPERREQVIEKLPPAQQERLRARLEKWDKLPAPQKALRLELLNRYASLPAEKQPAYLRQIEAVNNLPPGRQGMVIRELRLLWRMPEDQRQARLSSDDYKGRFSPAELEMLGTISASNPLPGR